MDTSVGISKQYRDRLIAEFNRAVCEKTFDWGKFQHFWSDHRQYLMIRNKRRQISESGNDTKTTRALKEIENKSPAILSITASWDLEYEKLQELKQEIEQSLEEKQDFFKPNHTENRLDDLKKEIERDLNSIEKDANGAYRIFKRQAFALKLQSLASDARVYKGNRPIGFDKALLIYYSEIHWAHLPVAK